MSKIEWTHRPGTKSKVLNPTTGCDKHSRGCKFCYAEVMHKRLKGMGQKKYQQPFLGNVSYWPEELSKPFGWKKPCTVFLNSMSDIFHKDITVKQIAEIYAMMFLTQWHTYIVLTKRADRASIVLVSQEFWEAFVDAVNNLPDAHRSPWGTKVWNSEELEERWPLKNVWQGVSIESQDHDHRAVSLLETPAHIRVISYEPAVGPLDLNRIRLNDNQTVNCLTGRWSWGHRYPHTDGGFSDDNGGNAKINWVIAGSESGHKAAPAHPDWFRTVRDQCKFDGVAFFFKQWGSYAMGSNINLKHNVVVLKNGDHGKHLDLARKYSVDKWNEQHPVVMHRCSKKESGNFLDGVQHLEFPA